jgi:anti-anti-sigma factor
MTFIGTSRLYRPEPSSIGVGEQWGRASVEAARSSGSLVLSIRGEVDASNAAQLVAYVERHVAIAGTLVVDTSAVDFFGPPALAALHRIDLCCSGGDVHWRLVVGPALRRVMRVCGTSELPRADSVESAVRQLVPDGDQPRLASATS